MQDQAGNGRSKSANATPGTPGSMPVEDVIGSVFLKLLADTQLQAQRSLSSENHAVQVFAADVKRRKVQPHGTYDDIVDLAATAAARVLVYGVDSPEPSRKDPASLTLYRKMRWAVRHCSPGATISAISQQGPTTDDEYGDGDVSEFEAIERQELMNEAYDSGYSVGFDAGIRAEAARQRQQSAGTSYAEGFTAGQSAEQDRVRTYLEEVSRRTGHTVVMPGLFSEATPHWSQAPRWSEQPNTIVPSSGQPKVQPAGGDARSVSPNAASQLSMDAMVSGEIDLLHQPPFRPPQPNHLAPASEAAFRMRHEARPRREGDSRGSLAMCVFCGRAVTAASLFNHKKRHHPAELAAAGVKLKYFPCWFPGCGMLQDNLVRNQLTTHLQRKHNCTPPGDPNGFTERLKYIGRMPRGTAISIISECAQQLNAVKERIKNLEAQLRIQTPTYVSRHGLPNVNHLHETRTSILDSILEGMDILPLALRELRQLTRARGMRSQTRHDEGTWWEVADDLEAALNPSGALSRAVAALPPPGAGPTVPMASGVLTEGPNMNDPSWEPQYSPLWQLNWVEPTDGNGENVGVIVHPDIPIPRTNFEIVIPYLSRPASTVYDQVEDEEDEAFQRFMAEIEQRVVVDNNDVSLGESEKTDGFEDDARLASDLSARLSSQRPQKRPGARSPMPVHKKHRKTAQTNS